jgi:hypothetical protein
MNSYKIILFAAIIAVLACQNAEKSKNTLAGSQNTEGSSSVNTDVAEAFARQFPKAEDVAWDTLETGLSASFFDGTSDCKAFFDAKGVFQYTSSFVEITALPQSAQRFLKEKYKNVNPAVVLSVKNAQTQTFQVELETASDYIAIEFDKNGKILKEQKQPLSNEELKRQEEEGVEKN